MKDMRIGFLIVLICRVFSLTSATVFFKPLSLSFPDLPAKSAVDVDSCGICGALHVADPINACSPLRSRFTHNATERIRFVLIARGECGFEEKVKNAQLAGFRSAIVFDDREKSKLVYMMVNPEGVKVHAVFVSKAAGEILEENAAGEPDECCIYPCRNGRPWTVLAISLFSLLVILILVVIVIFTPRNCLDWQGRNQHCLKSVDSKMVEALPHFLFSSARSSNCRGGETCAICLEDYKDGEIIKVLPCQHEFHSSCVDSWLTKWGTFCPVCKLDMRTMIAKSEGQVGNPTLESAWK
ncbi:PA domain-containing protein/zf-RING_2 domain-containing protein [Cephalotus follicularis]|uniref:PA domain-containing protein/zf-RING_2 domain-containing protein n=1 Tax=Cephalotus follicularis TaxID=3775 RepID=A0A1Q3BUZ7_CEPFO|nr:PA domain-containing protein/zf-RING_2 domain-containing protein [Cephalotus follicularis]